MEEFSTTERLQVGLPIWKTDLQRGDYYATFLKKLGDQVEVLSQGSKAFKTVVPQFASERPPLNSDINFDMKTQYSTEETGDSFDNLDISADNSEYSSETGDRQNNTQTNQPIMFFDLLLLSKRRLVDRVMDAFNARIDDYTPMLE